MEVRGGAGLSVLGRTTPRHGGGALVVGDLLSDFDRIVELLVDRTACGEVVDAYLLAAGAAQIAEDALQRDRWGLLRVAGYFGAGRGRPLGRVLSALGRSLEWLAERTRSGSRTARWLADLAAQRDELARGVAGGEPVGPCAAATARSLRERLDGLSRGTRTSVLRLPACFRSFDQHPADMVTLASRFAERHPDRSVPVLVVGVRTSGSYLAPLVAAGLQAAGYRAVTVQTVRPGHRLRAPLRRAIAAVVSAGGRIAVVDDPPVTGGSIAAAVTALVARGARRDSISVLLPLLAGRVPPALERYDPVVLEHADWAIHAALTPAAVSAVLSELTGRAVRHVRQVGGSRQPSRRAHQRGVYEVTWDDADRRQVTATGAGYGYFGRHSLAVAQAVGEHLPTSYGFSGGLVFRDWLPDADRLTAVAERDVPALAGYVSARSRAMPVESDRARSLAGREPVWEIAARILQRAYGPAGVLLRPLVLDPVMRRVCTTERPAVVDGAMGVEHWFRAGDGLRKVEADVRAFANTDLACYDPVYDLAGIDPGGDDGVVAALRAAMRCDDERFLLYELVQLWDRARRGADTGARSARAVRRYVTGQLLAGVSPPETGPLCALDLEGALESDALGFVAPTPSAVLALRALLAHGRRPVLLGTGDLDHLRQCCDAYRCAGGVAGGEGVAYLAATADSGSARTAKIRRGGAGPAALAALAHQPEGAVITLDHAASGGLTRAVSAHLGHRPGSCPTCRAPRATRRAQALLAVLDAAGDAGPARLPAAAWHGFTRALALRLPEPASGDGPDRNRGHATGEAASPEPDTPDRPSGARRLPSHRSRKGW